MIYFKLKYYYHFILLPFMIYSLWACHGEEKPSKELEQAFELHLESIEIRENINEKLSGLSSKTDTSFTKDKQIALDSIQLALKTWDELLIEVPGFEHEHNHEGHHHHHHDDDNLQLSPTEHLEVQQYLLTEIKRILENIQQLENS